MNSAPQQNVSRWVQVAAAFAAALVLLSGCTGSAGPDAAGPSVSASVNGGANDADLHFAETMPGHHDQAIEMSKMLLGKPRVKAELIELAKGVQATHQVQLDTMRAWSDTWAAAPAAPHTDEANGSSNNHHGGQGGLLTERQMEELDLADTPNAQKLYLDGMIRHHQGALALAADEVRNGKEKDALTLAQAIVDAHPDDVATMTALRTTL